MLLGILGGLGPMSTAYFMEMIIGFTKADCDQQHIDMLVSSRATTYDRTAYILGNSPDNPLDMMIPDAQKLVRAGCSLIAIPCNTAHYFYEQIQMAVDVPVLNIMDQTIKEVKSAGCKKAGILATTGTVSTGAYQQRCAGAGLDFAVPGEKEQGRIMDLIYGRIKSGEAVNLDIFEEVVHTLKAQGCDAIILGCTELSELKRNFKLGEMYFDSLEILAKAVVTACGKTLK